MIVLTAPERMNTDKYINVFLAGGITNCENWQKEVIDRLNKKIDIDDVALFNPRRDNFDINNPNASYEQIKWEFDKLNIMDIFSMYFANSESVQPICFYELGRHLERMKNRFPNDYKNRIVISIEDGFKRKQDVIIQTKLALGLYYNSNVIIDNSTPKLHAEAIYNKLITLKNLTNPYSYTNYLTSINNKPLN